MSFVSAASPASPISLSVVMITYNAERLLEAVLIQAAKIADEIVIIDSGSTDETLKIAKKYTQKVFHQDWLGFGPQKQKALEMATGDWILVLDADEILDENLLESIREIKKYETFDAYEIKRPLVFAGKIIRRSVPLWTTRLFRRGQGKFSDKVVHESLEITGEVGRIHQGELLHYSYASVGDWLLRMHKYTDLFVEEHLERKSKSISFAVLSAMTVFIKIFVLKMGFLEGRIGFVIAFNWAISNYIKYVKLALREDFTVDAQSLLIKIKNKK